MTTGSGGVVGGRGGVEGDGEVEEEERQDRDACQSPLLRWRSSKRVGHSLVTHASSRFGCARWAISAPGADKALVLISATDALSTRLPTLPSSPSFPL